ncbi:hypothetical protein CVCC1112_1727 [Paenarthrobacter nicotinovorans]|nr:hypothetical protein CVCC1112_1727 [Paenarthrobacter nicotinovorans]
MALSYHTGIPFNSLAFLPQPILSEYFNLLQQEAEASKRR